MALQTGACVGELLRQYHVHNAAVSTAPATRHSHSKSISYSTSDNCHNNVMSTSMTSSISCQHVATLHHTRPKMPVITTLPSAKVKRHQNRISTIPVIEQHVDGTK